MKKATPFYKNLSDDTHCFQACLRMVLRFFYPERNYSFKELDKISKKVKKKWTWPMATLVAFKRMGFKVKFHSKLDYKKFAKSGEKYLKKLYPKDAEKMIEMSDIPSEIKNTKEMLKCNIFTTKRISLEEIFEKFQQSYLVILNINSRVLNCKKGFSGHFIIITGFDKNNIFFHDPGLPPESNRRVSKKLFLKAWQYPQEEYDTILIKK